MRFKFTIFLLTLNLIAFGLITYFNKLAIRSGALEDGLSAQIGRGLADADRIELRGRGLDSPRIIERSGSNWTLTAPMKWSANYFAISRILNQLQFIEEEASFSIDEIERTGQSLADYGLDVPVLELSIGEGTKKQTISIGTLTEIGNNIYLLGPNRDEVFVVNRQVIDGLLVDLNDLRNREIFNIPVFEVDALSLQIRSDSAADNSFLKVRLARNSGDWTFEAPVSAGADPALVDSTINTLTTAKVRGFVEETEDNSELFGLNSPFMQVTIHGNSRRQTLIIGNEVPDIEGPTLYFAKLEDNPAVFTVLSRPFDALREAQEALRQRNFMRFDAELLSTINITEGQRTIRLQKLETTGWQVLQRLGDSEIQPRRADPKIMEATIESLAGLRATDFVVDNPSTADEERLGFGMPNRIIELNFVDGKSILLQLAHPEDEVNDLYAKTNGADFIYAVDRRTTLNFLPINALYYRNRTLDALPQAADIRSLRLLNLLTGKTFIDVELSRDDQNWTEQLSQMPPEKADRIQSLLAKLRQFEVKRYLFDRYENAYPLNPDKSLPWVFRLSATISLPGGETERLETLEYDFTQRLSGTVQVGASKKQGSIFEIPQGLIDTLHALTDDMELPPEASGGDLELPKTITPIEEPVALESESAQ